MSINRKNISKKDYTLVAKELVKELIDDITGENEEWLFGKIPSEHVMIGMIDGDKKEESIIKGEDVDNQRFEFVPSIGLRFRLNKNSEKIQITLKGKFFYRTMPTYNDQIRYIVDIFSKKYDSSIKCLNDVIKYVNEQSSNPEYKEPSDITIVPIYKSIKLQDLGTFELVLSDFKSNTKKLNALIAERLNELIASIVNESIACKKVHRKVSSFFTEDGFNAVINANVEKNYTPRWEIELYTDGDCYDKYNEYIIQLINNTDKAVQACETAIFNGGIIVKSDNGFLPIEINSLKHYYADKPTMPAIGNNCTVYEKDDRTLYTENIPTYYQNRIITIDKFNSYIEFKSLINNPVDNLNFIHSEMIKKKNEYDALSMIIKNKENDEYYHSFCDEVEDFNMEIIRFKYGIELIQNRKDVRKAFELMNQTFSMNKKYSGWRMFQIVFIVSEIADIINCEYKKTPGFYCNDINSVDLIYFPTGGGKTETFLGCTIFAAFFDRLREKENGVTAIIKYPLRLLAAQQLDRVLQLTINANIVKHEHNLLGDDFSVGFFTGSKNTPNKIDEKKRLEIEGMPQDTKNSLYRQIDICPVCKAKYNKVSDMNINFDEEKWVLTHKCSNPECGFVPPIFIVDDEVYRFAPTFVISTIDKMANIGTNVGFRCLFGQSKSRCPQHGFVVLGNKCGVNKCKCKIEQDIDRKDPIPTLSIQDELHLVNESLGTFDSHYESLIQYYCENLVPANEQKTIKYIGATATISNYIQHIRGLYNKNAKKFPSTVRKDNFYSKESDDISRIIIGAALYGGSITESIQKIVTLMRIIVTNWIKQSNDKLVYLKSIGFDGNIDALNLILQDYIIAIIYNNSKNDAGTIRAILENQGNNALISEGMQQFRISEITGDIEFKTIKSAMHDIESIDNKFDTNNIVIATSAISHGVDEDCFNQIYFFGMPNQTSEYIQAYSRVGRAYTGIVFDVFRIIRDRDKSYLKNYDNFHRYKDLLIDPVPINRYAKNAIYSTLPGIVSALLYQHYAKKWFAIEVTKLINLGLITYDQLKNDVETIYGCDQNESQLYKEIIDEELTRIYKAFVTNTSTDILISELIKNANSKHKGPMTNLRDVDVALEINLRGE